MPSSSASQRRIDVLGTVQRVLATAAAVLVGIALLGFALTLAQLALRTTWTWLADGPWPYAFLLPVVALPAGLLCVISLLVLSAVGKGRGRG